MEEIHSACQDAVNGLPSQRPVIEMTIPSVLDKTISPPGTSDHLALKNESYIVSENNNNNNNICIIYVITLGKYS